MSSFLPPSFNTSIFNSNAFAGGSYITKAQADLLYLNLASGENLYMLELTPGITQASRALVYNSSGSIDSLKIEKNTGDLITLTAIDSNGRSTINYSCVGINAELGLRASSASSYPSHMYIYGNGAYRQVQSMLTGALTNFGTMMIDVTSDHLSFKNGSTTSKFSQSATTLTLSSSVTSATLNLNAIGFNIDSSGSHLSFKNSSNTAFMELSGSNILRTIAGVSMNQDASGVRIDSIGNTSAARSRLDLGSSASDRTFSLFNNTTSYYGISANNTALQYQSNANHLWTTGCTDASPLGTTIMSMNNTGSLVCYDNTIMRKGFFIERQAFSSTGRNGRGISMFYANTDSVAKCFAYNYTTPAFEGLQLGNIMLCHGASQSVTIDNGVTIPGSYPLTVGNWFNTSFVGSYGYLSTGGAGTGSSTGSADVSIYANKRVWAQEFDAFSDRRLKENIKDLSEDDSIDFVRNVKPVQFNWKADKDKKRSIGYIAQSILKHGKFDELVSLGPDQDLEEEIEIVDGQRFISPKGFRFNVSYQSAVPILHNALASLFDYVEEITTDIEDLRKMLDPLKKKKM